MGSGPFFLLTVLEIFDKKNSAKNHLLEYMSLFWLLFLKLPIPGSPIPKILDPPLGSNKMHSSADIFPIYNASYL